MSSASNSSSDDVRWMDGCYGTCPRLKIDKSEVAPLRFNEHYDVIQRRKRGFTEYDGVTVTLMNVIANSIRNIIFAMVFSTRTVYIE